MLISHELYFIFFKAMIIVHLSSQSHPSVSFIQCTRLHLVSVMSLNIMWYFFLSELHIACKIKENFIFNKENSWPDCLPTLCINLFQSSFLYKTLQETPPKHLAESVRQNIIKDIGYSSSTHECNRSICFAKFVLQANVYIWIRNNSNINIWNPMFLLKENY